MLCDLLGGNSTRVGTLESKELRECFGGRFLDY